ncbi:MAG: hypothetical protein JST67_00235 [Bacteroidetes bacterium]|nr:hypothetical protein [Bacteroidota bacterium]
MPTIHQLFAEHTLSKSDIKKLSAEARATARVCGKKDDDTKLTPRTWNLFQDFSEKIWDSSLSNSEKINASFQLYDLFPSYYHFLVPFYRALCSRTITKKNEKSAIWNGFVGYLSSQKGYYTNPLVYALWCHFFEDKNTVSESWHGLLKNSTQAIRLLLLKECSGPVPFYLKEPVYTALIKKPVHHAVIFTSLFHSAYDTYGRIDKKKAYDILQHLQISKKTKRYQLLDKKLS